MANIPECINFKSQVRKYYLGSISHARAWMSSFDAYNSPVWGEEKKVKTWQKHRKIWWVEAGVTNGVLE